MASDTFLSFVRAGLSELRPSQFEDVARLTGVPLSTIRKVHYGEVDDPRIGTVQALHDFFAQGGAAQLRKAA